MKEESEKAGLKLNIKKKKLGSWQLLPSLHGKKEGEKVEAVTDFLLLGSKSLQMVTPAMKLEDIYFLEGKLWQPGQCIKRQSYHFADKGLYNKSYGLSSSHVQMWDGP